MADDVLLGVATPTVCVCGSVGCQPDECVWARLTAVARTGPLEQHRREVTLPPCEVCGFDGWPDGGMFARSIHMRAHERRGEVDG